ncbi:hypothetical protein [Bradyrhizobium sp. Gha]|uniref:hypothetical protein n=1 Tax=Bradyrhizobium sp. Gha TaxID=1855318 RepID=UPI001FCD85B8|nr:hypothetical protein [Bradyrhizobium sp. Gha]
MSGEVTQTASNVCSATFELQAQCKRRPSYSGGAMFRNSPQPVRQTQQNQNLGVQAGIEPSFAIEVIERCPGAVIPIVPQSRALDGAFNAGRKTLAFFGCGKIVLARSTMLSHQLDKSKRNTQPLIDRGKREWPA